MRRRSHTCSGIALIEVLIASAITATLFVAAVSTAASARVTRQKSLDRTTGYTLASALMAELNDRAYCEPGAPASDPLGRDTGETVGQRQLFDDIDDYHGYSQAAPATLDGTPLAGSSWAWSVSVTRASSLSGTASSTETGLRQVTVTVTNRSRLIARLSQIRTKAGG